MPTDTLYPDTDLAHSRVQFVGVCRRKFKRFRFNLATLGYLAIPKKDGSCQEVWLVDISALGIGLSSDGPLEVGKDLVLKLTTHSNGPILLGAKVVHSTKQPSGDWRIGCQFDKPL